MNHSAWFFILLLILTQTSCALHSLTENASEVATPISGYVTVGKLPFQEAWYGVYFLEDKVGYSHVKIEPSDQNFSHKYGLPHETHGTEESQRSQDEREGSGAPGPYHGLISVRDPHERRRYDDVRQDRGGAVSCGYYGSGRKAEPRIPAEWKDVSFKCDFFDSCIAWLERGADLHFRRFRCRGAGDKKEWIRRYPRSKARLGRTGPSGR